MKTFEEVQNEMDDWEKECLMTSSEFIDGIESGLFTSYDGVGNVHDGNGFITDGFEVSIFTFIKDKAKSMSIEDFIEKYPYIAWYNK
jgi:hypothetical protein